MPRNWIAVDLDRRVWLEGAGRLDDWFSNCAALTLETLRIPCVNDKIDSMLCGRFAHQRTAPLLRLPPELLHEILSALNPTGAYAPAVFLFATTCKLALALAQPHIARLQRSHYAPLAGHRLVCLADGPGTLAHCPAGFFTPAEACALGGAPDTPLYGLIRKAWSRYTPDPPALLRPTDILWRPRAVSRISMGAL
ncbi:uncharacterized protein TRAVEDRAFT_45493 [Trametes versicolor FP-101664 SS1]|uniref:uncharacterized protein n=1 Tax=Trametes versicolor (strain FP-101664) TaxID=717944 RepID=UPI0004623161|nr:uncharacterized protein TRAVEDRAFT_45493 [Trametes versicolor FP-101664 SS1]EIW60246.1 hypothetical protein TRAVEDRAFT_45493 [Trametes versicolor FP-101664 SS1]